MALPLAVIENKTLLTVTSGFLDFGYTHSINLYHGCGYAHSLCGAYCYAQHNFWITEGRPWALFGVKADVVDAYHRDYDKLKRPKKSLPKPLRIYMSSVSDPYPPQEHRLGIAKALLAAMLDRPPDVLVIQTHGTLIGRDLDLIRQLSKSCGELWVSLTVETDLDRIAGLPPHASLPRKRIATLKRFREQGIRTQATVSPLLPIGDPESFAQALEEACDRVILDHYLIGDGSKGGMRTRHTRFPEILEAAGFGRWSQLRSLWEIQDIFHRVLGKERVLVSQEGFNAVG